MPIMQGAHTPTTILSALFVFSTLLPHHAQATKDELTQPLLGGKGSGSGAENDGGGGANDDAGASNADVMSAKWDAIVALDTNQTLKDFNGHLEFIEIEASKDYESAFLTVVKNTLN